MLAHDFRSPLGSAISMMRLVRDDDSLEREELDMLYNSIETDMQNILLTFDNILQWVKKQMAGFVYDPEELSVRDIMDDATTIFKDILLVKKVSIVNNVAVDLTVITDREVMQFINRNLIHNAIKFSREGATVTLNARHTDSETIFSVADTGRA
ncbi:hypothetical protein DJ568_14590 [Mucilaginibacter hurinus]|uniref:histidine kinase n=2 Tax=Mucilaginibacter hurinus TaxID=2201324 RepID=A0A367GML0_9SPHI|nr:hypothetical protein [Mucilaginibacter hurinus]RCH54106.1 hypothetical protein DJ568_14590 [Mucilaginibacter hurinus]